MADVSPANLLDLESLTRCFPVRSVRKILKESGRESIRERDLPAHVMVYYVIAMTLYMQLPYRDVLRQLLDGCSRMLRRCKRKPPVKSSISKARARVGWEPFQKLHDQFVKPVAQSNTKGAWYKHWLLVGLDGSTVDVADTRENDLEFGRMNCDRAKAAFPMLRFVSLLEIGTRVLFGTRFGSYDRHSEKELAKQVVLSLRKNILCLADRYFLGYEFIKIVLATEADVLCCANHSRALVPEKILADGSYLSTIIKRQLTEIMGGMALWFE